MKMVSAVHAPSAGWLDVVHRRRIFTEVKTKVVAASWGDDRIASIPCRTRYFVPGRVEE